MTAIYWPSALRLTAAAPPRLEMMDRSGGPALGGGEQITESPTGRWVMQVTTVIRDRATLLAWHALAASLRGRGGEILMPVASCLTQPGTLTTTAFVEAGGATTFFDDGFGFVEEGTPALLSATAPLNSTTLDVTTAAALAPGHYIGLADRLHLIAEVTPLDGAQRLTITPWTRAAHVPGTAVLLRTAVCRMRLKDPAQLSIPVSLGRFAAPTLDFVEAF